MVDNSPKYFTTAHFLIFQIIKMESSGGIKVNYVLFFFYFIVSFHIVLGDKEIQAS